MPYSSPPPSNAGPDAQEQLSSLPWIARLISVFVPISSATVGVSACHALVASSMET